MENPPLLDFAGWILIFITSPIPIIEEIIELSPLLIKGSGNPVFGRSKVTTQILVNTWNMYIDATPTAIIFPR